MNAPQARPYATVRRRARLRWLAGLAVETAAFLAFVVAVIAAMSVA